MFLVQLACCYAEFAARCVSDICVDQADLLCVTDLVSFLDSALLFTELPLPVVL